MLWNVVLIGGLLAMVFGLYMIVQPDKGTRVSLFKEKRNILSNEQFSVIKHYFYTEADHSITFMTITGESEHGTCVFFDNQFQCIDCKSGRIIRRDEVSAAQIAVFEGATA